MSSGLPVKVLVVGPDRSDPGGVANYYNAVFPRLASDDVEVHYLEIGSTKSSGGKFHLLTDQLRLWRALGRINPDIVHLNPSLDLRSYLRDGAFSLQVRLRRKKLLVFFHGWQQSFADSLGGALACFFRSTFGHSDATIVLARNFEQQLRRLGLKSPVHLGNTAVANELLETFSIDEKVADLSSTQEYHLLYLSRLEHAKGVLALVDAVGILLREGAGIYLTVAGTGPAMADLRTKVEALGPLGERISMVGYVRNESKVEVLGSHHIFCFPTQYGEGMPTAVLEAMAFGMPVITCAVGGIGDFFEDPGMGRLLPSADPALIAAAVRSLVSDAPGLGAVGRYNYNYAQHHFLASRAADFLRQRYLELAVTE